MPIELKLRQGPNGENRMVKIDLYSRNDFDYVEYFQFLADNLDGRVDQSAVEYFQDVYAYNPAGRFSLHDSKIFKIEADHDSDALKITYLTIWDTLVCISYDCFKEPSPHLNFSAFWSDLVFHRLAFDEDFISHELLFADGCLTTIPFKQVRVEKLER